MNVKTLFKLVKLLRKEGDSVIDQLESVLSGEGLDDQNPNALRAMLPFLERASSTDVEGAEELAEEIRQYLADAEA